jgi:hypothetical protein
VTLIVDPSYPDFQPQSSGLFDGLRQRAILYTDLEPPVYFVPWAHYQLGSTWYFGEPNYVLPIKLFIFKDDTGDWLNVLWSGGRGPYTVFRSESPDFSNPTADHNCTDCATLATIVKNEVPNPVFYWRVQGK